MRYFSPILFLFLSAFCCWPHPDSDQPSNQENETEEVSTVEEVVTKPEEIVTLEEVVVVESEEVVTLEEIVEEPLDKLTLLCESDHQGIKYELYLLDQVEVRVIKNPLGNLIQFYEDFYISPEHKFIIVTRDKLSSENLDLLLEEFGSFLYMSGKVDLSKKGELQYGVDVDLFDLFLKYENINDSLFGELVRTRNFRNDVIWIDGTFVRFIINPTEEKAEIMPGFCVKSRYILCPETQMDESTYDFFKEKLKVFSFFAGPMNGQKPFYSLKGFSLD